MLNWFGDNLIPEASVYNLNIQTRNYPRKRITIIGIEMGIMERISYQREIAKKELNLGR